MRKDKQTRKLLIRTATHRLRPVARQRRLAANNEPAVRLTLAVLMWLAATPPVAEGRAAQSAPAAPLDLQITQVRQLAALTATATADIEIRWTARVPRPMTLEGFDVSVEVRYSDGARGTANAPSLKATARSATLQVAAHPKANGTATLKSFHASIRARFKIASSLTVVQPAAANGGNAHAEAGQPQVAITDARLAPGCAANRECIDVRWTASAPRNTTFEGFTIGVEAQRRDGARRTDSKNVGAADRQTRLAVDTAGSAVASFKVTLNADFASLDSRTVTRDGAF